MDDAATIANVLTAPPRVPAPAVWARGQGQVVRQDRTTAWVAAAGDTGAAAHHRLLHDNTLLRQVRPRGRSRCGGGSGGTHTAYNGQEDIAAGRTFMSETPQRIQQEYASAVTDVNVSD